MSPGCARKGIGVGATNKNDQIASFSSRGPTSKYNIKPDVTAPGVSICSSQYDDAWSTSQCYDNQHVAISGTSMATPHVAGAAALLLQYHPTWTPQMVKSVLMSTSKDLGLSIWDQGAGRIDVYEASQAEIATYPQSISFGRITEPNISQVFTIQNLANGSIDFNLTVSNVTDSSGNEYNMSSLNASSVTIAHNTNATINLTVDIGNEEGTFYGYVNITSVNGTYRVPYGFIKISSLTVNVTDLNDNPLNPIFIVVHSDDMVTREIASYWDFDGSSHTFGVESGNYSAHAIGDYSNRSLTYILTNTTELPVGGSVTVNLSLSGARVFNVTAYDLNNNSLDLYRWNYLLKEEKGSYSFSVSVGTGTGFHGDRIVYISDTENDSSLITNISLSYIGFTCRGHGDSNWVQESFDTADELYLMGWILNEVNSSTDTILNYSLADIGTYNVTYNYPGNDPHQGAEWLSGSYSGIVFWISPATWIDASGWYRFTPPLNRTFYVKDSNSWGFWPYMYINYLHTDTLGGDWRNEFGAACGQQEYDKRTIMSWPYGVRIGDGNSVKASYGTSPYIPMYFQNTNTKIRLQDRILSGYLNKTYMYKKASATWYSSTGETGIVALPTPNIKVYRAGSLIYNSTSKDHWNSFSYSPGAGNYLVNVTIPTGYPLFNTTIVTANFTLSAGDSDPPKLLHLDIPQRFEYSKDLSIVFNMTDDTGMNNVTTYYSYDNRTWFILSTTNQSNIYSSTLTVGDQNATEVNVKIVANDTTGNEINFTFLPASMLGHNVSLNFSASSTDVNQGDTITFTGKIIDSENGNNVTGVRIVYYLNDSYYNRDRSETYESRSYGFQKGEFGTSWTVPSNWPSGVYDFSAIFNGTGIYLPNTTTISIRINVTLPTYSAVSITPTSPDVNDNVQAKSTWNNEDKVLFGSNYTGTYTYFGTTKTGSIYNYTIPANSTSASVVVVYSFKANNSDDEWVSTPNYTYTVKEITTNITAGQTLLGVDVNQNNTLWCDYTEVGADDVIGATVNAYIDSANKTMSYSSGNKRYEYIYNVSGSLHETKTWICYANKTNYTSQSVTSSFAIQNETEIPAYSNVTRTSDPIYTDTNVTMNSTWTDNAGLSFVIFSSNYTNTWINYTITTNPNQPYNASFTILSSNFSSNQVVGWKFIANDTSQNWNTYMPVQTFTVQNRDPWVAFDYNETDKGWGEDWTFKCNCSDADEDAVNISLWSKPPGGSWILEETQGTNGSLQQVTFGPSQFFNASYIGNTTQVKCNVTDGKSGTNETSVITITVEEDDVEVNITQGSGESVQRENTGNYTITFEIRAYDTDRDEYINSPSGKIYVTKTGTNEAFDVFDCTSYANGTCSIQWNPPDDTTVGSQYFFGGTYSNAYYKDVNSSQATFTVLGTLVALVNGPTGVFNKTSTIYLNTTTVEDPFGDNDKVSVETSDVRLEYKLHEAAGWERCTNVIEATDANYYCSLDTSNFTYGWYDVRYSAEKANYTSFINTHSFRFRIIYVHKFTVRRNFTANETVPINATTVNTTIEIRSIVNLTDVDVNITLNSTNPTPINLIVRELERYLSINVSNNLANNLSFAVIKVNYTDDEVDNSGIIESSLRLYQYNGTDWVGYNNQSSDRIGGVSTSENYVWANVTSFSDFGLGGLKDNGQSCSADSECNSGNCAEDYDGGGAWCAPAGNCVHDYVTTYTTGTATCYGNYREVCNSGEWSSGYCAYGCSNGVCGSAPSRYSEVDAGTTGGGVEETTTTTLVTTVPAFLTSAETTTIPEAVPIGEFVTPIKRIEMPAFLGIPLWIIGLIIINSVIIVLVVMKLRELKQKHK